MRISDWSSDVCSSDLGGIEPSGAGTVTPGRRPVRRRLKTPLRQPASLPHEDMSMTHDFHPTMLREYDIRGIVGRSEEHTSELQSLMRISYAVFCLKKKKNN